MSLKAVLAHRSLSVAYPLSGFGIPPISYALRSFSGETVPLGHSASGLVLVFAGVLFFSAFLLYRNSFQRSRLLIIFVSALITLWAIAAIDLWHLGFTVWTEVIPPITLSLLIIKPPSQRDCIAAFKVIILLLAVAASISIFGLVSGWDALVSPNVTRNFLSTIVGISHRSWGIFGGFFEMSLGSIMLFAYALNPQNRGRYIVAGLAGALALASDSRAGYVAIVIMAAIGVVTCIRAVATAKGNRGVVSRNFIIPSVLGIVSLGSLLPSTLVGSASIDEKLNQFGSGRLDIWSWYVSHLWDGIQKPLGLGSREILDISSDSNGLNSIGYAHNFFLDIAVRYGLVGFSLAILMVAIALFLTWRVGVEKAYWESFLVVVGLVSVCLFERVWDLNLWSSASAYLALAVFSAISPDRYMRRAIIPIFGAKSEQHAST